MLNQIVIKPNYGIEGLRLGSKKNLIQEILGTPDNTTTGNIPECDFRNNDETWEYNSLGLELTLSSEYDYLLGSISITSEEAILFDCHFIGLNENEFLNRIQNACPYPVFLEDDLSEVDSRNYRCEELSLDFWINENILEAITIFPEYDETGEHPLWPKDN